MCSRYYIDPGMTEDISRVVQNIDGRIWLAQGDTRPTDVKKQGSGHQCKGRNCFG